MNDSKAQIIGQVFVFILAALVFILIISYGYRSINYFLERQDETVLFDVKNDLEQSVENARHDFQSVRKLHLRLPSKYAGVCFLNYNSCASPVLNLGNRNVFVDRARDACLSKSANVFIVPNVRDFDIPALFVEGLYLCVPNNGGVTLRLEGAGDKVKVSAWQEQV